MIGDNERDVQYEKNHDFGGNMFQASVIKRAKELGYYVISVDYLPNNPGRRFSD